MKKKIYIYKDEPLIPGIYITFKRKLRNNEIKIRLFIAQS